MPSPFEPFTDASPREVVVRSRSLRMVELDGPYFREGVMPAPHVLWLVQVLSRIEVHNYPIIDRLVLRDDSSEPYGVGPSFSLYVHGYNWLKHDSKIEDKVVEVAQGATFQGYMIKAAHAADDTDAVLRPAKYLITSFMSTMSEMHVCIR
jgi:hypothetical protein